MPSPTPLTLTKSDSNPDFRIGPDPGVRRILKFSGFSLLSIDVSHVSKFREKRP